jgi:protein-S-isoprenylcysteine O-methyltransferase Ste14
VQQLTFAWLATGVFAASLGYFLYAYLFTFGVSDPVGPTGPARPALIDFSLFTLFAVHHSLFARTRFKHLVHALVSPALERAVYTLVASALFLLVCALWQPVPGVLYALSGPWRWTGYAAQAAGIVLTIVGSRALDVLDLSGVRQVRSPHSPGGRGEHRLETGGVYGLVRHPLYFGWALFVFGAPHMTLTRFTFAVISTAYLAIAIPLEERSLVETFGKEYEAYRRKVRWRMLPGIY